MLDSLAERAGNAIPIVPLGAEEFRAWLERQPARIKSWLRASGFKAAPGEVCLVPDAKGGPAQVLFGRDAADAWSWAALPAKLPAGTYAIRGRLDARAADWAALGWALAQYRFGRYKSKPAERGARLVWPRGADRARVSRILAAYGLVRDLVNTPAEEMGPAELAQAAAAVARRHRAQFRAIVGERLLAAGFPSVHRVGRASTRPPRLIELRWGPARAPRVTLVGKGVCFDSGGLDIKTSAQMKLMKKDMGGAAHALALGAMIMDARLRVRLRVLIPAVDNAISGNAMRPLDVIRARGRTVEIGNTDAEGRLILSDCLAEAAEEKPALLIDFATLTGAARTALGPELPALFTQDDALAAELLAAAGAEADPLWRLPLWAPYRKLLDSKVADVNSAPESPFAGAITAALFLREFVPEGTAWAHLDLYAWNAWARPGRPEGGEAMALRAIFRMLEGRYGAKK